jgi:flagellar assembly protein FliH
VILKDTILSMERVPLRLFEPPAESRVAGIAVEVPQPAIQAQPPPPPEPEPLDVETVLQWLEEQGAAARASLAGVLAADLAQLRATAKREGAAEGHREGIERAQQETAARLAVFASLAESAETAFVRESQLLADQCCEIVAEALTRVAGTALASREAVLGVVTAVLAQLKDEREVVVRAGEDDLALLQAELPALCAAASGREVTLLADRRVSLGGCIVETRLGNLDARLESQLAGLFETIRAARQAREEPA